MTDPEEFTPAETQGIDVAKTREQIAIRASFYFDCDATQNRHRQCDAIHSDFKRLLDADTTTGVQCQAVSIESFSSEAESYQLEASGLYNAFQADRMLDGLKIVFSDIEPDARTLVAYAFCDLRHLCKSAELDFVALMNEGFELYRAECE